MASSRSSAGAAEEGRGRSRWRTPRWPGCGTGARSARSSKDLQRRKGIGPSWTALKSIRASRPDGAPLYMILDNLSAHKNWRILRRAARNKVGCCTPTNASWANPIEAHFGPLRQFTLANSNHPNHTVQTRELHRCPRCATRTPAIPMSWPPSCANAPASAARRASAGADDQLPPQREVATR
jgi:hypothetical protein